MPLGVQPQTVTVGPDEIDPTVVQVQEPALGGKVRIDAASGNEFPKELLYGRRMSATLARMVPVASIPLQIAARGADAEGA